MAHSGLMSGPIAAGHRPAEGLPSLGAVASMFGLGGGRKLTDEKRTIFGL